MSSGVALLEVLQPPPGYRTDVGLLTTFSADLVTCLATLIAMDGGAEDENFGKVAALRAVDRLRDRVIIVAHPGRMGMPQRQLPRIVSLLDQLLRNADVDPRVASFHPKVALVRQVSPGAVRHLLVIGSRNLTRNRDWDYGVALAAEGGVSGTRKLKGLKDFIRGVCRLGGDREFATRFGDLDQLRWLLPDGVKEIAFGATAGGPPSGGVTELARVPIGDRVLALSPFLTSDAVKGWAKRNGTSRNVRLVAGRRDLDKVSRSLPRSTFWDPEKGKRRIGQVWASVMDLGSDEPNPSTESDVSSDESDDRGLHAKVFGSANGRAATLLVGSANLTKPAWSGPNWEAFVRLHGDTKILFDPLWAWADKASTYIPPAPKDLEKEKKDVLDDVRRRIAGAQFHIDERLSRGPRVSSPAIVSALRGHRCQFEVWRITQPEAAVRWPSAADGVGLPLCEPEDRTSLLGLRLRIGAEQQEWIQLASISPKIDESRDRAVFARELGVDDFLGYLQAIATGEVPGVNSDEAGGGSGSGRSQTRQGQAIGSIHLEDLLRALTTSAQVAEELDLAIKKYGEAVERAAKAPAERQKIADFKRLWSVIHEGLMMP